MVTRELTSKEAVAFAEAGEWKAWTPEQRGEWQLRQTCLAMPFDVFQEGVEKLLGRPVWTHEFARPQQLLAEYEGREKAPTMAGVVAKLDEMLK